jgi:hypothetical protein
MRRIALALLSLVVLAACASAQKTADQAAATGDWKTAEANYAAVLRDDPGNAEKRAHWVNARQNALKGAIDHCKACQVSQDWECAFAEADYLVQMEPGSADYAALRAEVGRQVAYGRLRRASEASAERKHKAAFDYLASARAASNDPALQAEAAKLQPHVVGAAVRDANQYRAQQQFGPALELLTLAAGLDASVRPQLSQVQAEYDAWLTAQYEAAAGQGDALLRDHRFGEAAAKYDEALRIRRGGRAEPLLRYARALQAGDAATQRKDWPAASHAYDEAVRTGMDGQGGYAAQQLERVALRPYAIRLRSVLVRPIRPDGGPWAGPPSPAFQRVVGMLANAAMEGRGAQLVKGLDVYDALPHENRPNLTGILMLPDGRQFATVTQQALRARWDAYAVFATNGLDDRPVTIRVIHQDERGTVEVGAVTVRMNDLVNNGEVRLADRAIVELKLGADRAGAPDGTLQGMAKWPPPAPHGPPPPRL